MTDTLAATTADTPSTAIRTVPTTTNRAEQPAALTGATTDRMTAAEFDQAFTAVMPRLRRRLLAVTGDPHDADDLVQETYLRLSGRARASALVRQHQPYAYTCAAALNLLRDSWRQPSRRERCTDRLPEPSWDGGLATREAEEVTTALLRVLSPKEAAAVILVDIEGLTHDMAGERLGAHRGTVQRNRMRGLAKMRAALGAYEPGAQSVTTTNPAATTRQHTTTTAHPAADTPPRTTRATRTRTAPSTTTRRPTGRPTPTTTPTTAGTPAPTTVRTPAPTTT
ncbi:RNA polymerase sigma factor [Streptomyces lavendulocolor]|uniref:RNA polymerase sigma factor n=1 Tax=Streptomyces lavendulocolor TaxID=67316 RepID=UPI003C2F3EAA